MSQERVSPPSHHDGPEPMTRAQVLRAFAKGIYLYLMFSLAYTSFAPLQNGLVPSLHHNGIIAGRVRLAQDYVINAELLINDHIIMTATADTYNIVVIGSSEMWGVRSLADDSTPVYMDRLNMVAADGRPVRVYNLSYPVPYALKDLIILDVLLERHIPIDLVIFSVLDETVTYFHYTHILVHGNLPLEMEVIKKYHLDSAYQYEWAKLTDSVPFTMSLSKDALAWQEWLAAQVRGIKWTLTRDEFVGVTPDYLQRGKTLGWPYDVMVLDRIDPPPNPDLVRVFQQARQESGIPILVLGAPVPYRVNEFAPWLQEQTAALELPLLDCWDTFRDATAFEDWFHLKPATQPLYGRVLVSYLADPLLADVDDGLPLVLPADFVMPTESCVFFPNMMVPKNN